MDVFQLFTSFLPTILTSSFKSTFHSNTNFRSAFLHPLPKFFLWISTAPFKSHVFIGHPLSGKGSINIQKVIVAATVGWKSNFRGRKKFEWRSNHVNIMLYLVSSRYEICSWASLSTRVLISWYFLKVRWTCLEDLNKRLLEGGLYYFKARRRSIGRKILSKKTAATQLHLQPLYVQDSIVSCNPHWLDSCILNEK